MKRTVQIEIAGARYRLSSDADADHLQRLADTVNKRIEELGPKAARAATPAQLLAVVALGLAEDLETAEGRQDALKARTREVVTKAIHRIDARLQADAQASSAPTPSE